MAYILALIFLIVWLWLYYGIKIGSIHIKPKNMYVSLGVFMTLFFIINQI